MDKENKAGNPGATAAGEGNVPDTSAGQDASAKIAELQARLEKESKEKEIYRAGLLAAKDLGKKTRRITQDIMEDPDKLEEAIDAKMQERELERKAAEDAEAQRAEIERIRRENEELRRAAEAQASARSSGGASQGVNERSESAPAGYWSEAQKAELRSIYASRGMYSEKQIAAMVAKAEEIASSKKATSERGNDIVATRRY